MKPRTRSKGAGANAQQRPLIIKLRNIQAEEAARLVKGLYPGITGSGDPHTNTLILVLDGQDEQGIREVVKAMDVKKDSKWTVFYLKNLQATEGALLLEQLGSKARIVPNPTQNG